ncbi:hypothetical protein ACM41_15955 [Bradyrhizobium sp. CCBAU 21362]|nr:hypothetical protein [Bradyrhizobium sp. CCBAU 21362]
MLHPHSPAIGACHLHKFIFIGCQQINIARQVFQSDAFRPEELAEHPKSRHVVLNGLGLAARASQCRLELFNQLQVCLGRATALCKVDAKLRIDLIRFRAAGPLLTVASSKDFA